MRITEVNIFSTPSKLLLLSIGLVVLTRGMQVISSILIPLFYAFYLTLLLAPLVKWLQKKEVPTLLSIGIVVLLFILIILVLGSLSIVSISQLRERIPTYQLGLTGYVQIFTQYIPYIDQITVDMFISDLRSFVINSVPMVINTIITTTATVVIIAILTVFLLLDFSRTPWNLQKEFETRIVLFEKLHKFSDDVVDYIIVRTETNLITGVGVAIALYIGGIEFALFWGVIMFVFSYIPYIGLILAAIPPVFLGLLQYGLTGAIAIFAFIWIFNIIIENVIFPSLAGRDLELSPSVVLVSLVYWTYVLGPAGALIATPLTMTLKVILGSFEETSELAKLMDTKSTGQKREAKDE